MVTVLCTAAAVLFAAGATDPRRLVFQNQPCDHFDASAWECTFNQTYYLDDSAWRGNSNPDAVIVFIPGGEAAMHGLYDYRILRDLAKDRGGLVLSMEHRFYGDSVPVPFPSDINTHRPDLRLLSIEQAIADYANIISVIREQFKCPQCPVVAGGGSCE